MVRIQLSVKLGLLLIRETDFVRRLYNGVPDVLDELETFGNAEAQYVGSAQCAHTVPTLPRAVPHFNLRLRTTS